MSAFAAAMYTLIKAKTPVIDLTALWHIVVVSVAAGCGLALAFGLILLGAKRGEDAKTGVEKTGGYLLAGLAAAFCVSAIAVGVYVMCNPPSTKPLKVVRTAAVTTARRSVA
jgi:uncharacterized membrane protein SpoIIM required for sporulation